MSDRSDVLAAFDAYLAAFMASDEEGIRECIQWPCTFIEDGRSVSRDTYPYSPTELRQEKHWATTIHLEIDLVAVTSAKAHLLLRNCERLRPDGSVIERISGYYAYTKASEGWKLFAMSAIALPA